eukprot:TRINITY_DN4972_c0_g1_i1.p1 TRINITY_DN4972_c0_g1~~TRINITY_DN4972_c0_g1_i1.p1  ORF type:complete len:652 (+),score=218.37 TRINITY_DN4972_c0_g1_i1:197-2152(+)
MTDTVDLVPYKPAIDEEVRLSSLTFELEARVIQQTRGKLEVDEKELITVFRKICKEQYFSPGQPILLDYFGNVFEPRVVKTQLFDLGIPGQKAKENVPGQLVEETEITFNAAPNDKFSIKGSSTKAPSIFKPDFNWESLEIGGLDKELADIFRQAFASRRYPPSVLAKYNIKHVKGVLLYGPPGTGKTLMAKQLSKALQSKEPKLVNGPELFDKYVGETERKIRDLFKDAKEDMKRYGDESPLHVIIFDEFDSICRQRGSVVSGTGVQDNAVNQLLSMMDGVDALNNTLMIGMTNRKDMLDEAVLRPGRFEVHIEVGLPDEKGRLQILNIHTRTMRENKLLEPDVDLPLLAHRTKNFTGAEIMKLVQNASSYAFTRGQDVMNFGKTSVVNEEVRLSMQDFVQALEETKPQFGADTDRFGVLLRGKIVDYGPRLKRVQDTMRNTISHLRQSTSQQLVSILLEGEIGCGKTALAAAAAVASEFPFIKLVSAENMLGLSDVGKINAMGKIFDDAYKAKLSLILIDDIERIIEFVDMGARFSNTVLQTLLIMIKRIPQKPENKIVILGTTSSLQTMKDLGISQSFNFTLNVPTLKADEIQTVLTIAKCPPAQAAQLAKVVDTITIKKLLLLIDMSMQNGVFSTEHFSEAFNNHLA